MDDGGATFDELKGIEVSEILLWGLIKIKFGDGRNHELSIERDFIIRTIDNPDGAVVEFRPYLPDWRATGMNELDSIFHSVVESASAGPDALLLITFTDGKSLEVQPDPQYEGWHFYVGGVRYGQVPSGGLM